MIEPKKTDTIFRTPNKHCGSCSQGRRHPLVDLQMFHPYAGHGFQIGQGWSHPDLAKEAEKKLLEIADRMKACE